MFEILQIYWWFIISLLAGIFVFMTFVQGGQTLLFCFKDEHEKDMIVNSIGKKWELTFTTLVMFGGACFAAFPLFYSTSFGGAYWVWMAILFCFIIQAVSYEYRKKPNNFLGQKTYEIFMFINGSLGLFLIGVALSTFFSGSEFSLNSRNFVSWQNPLRGLEALGNPLNYLLGFALIFAARVGGSLYLINHIDEESLRVKFRKHLKFDTLFFVLFFVAFLFWISLKDGFYVVDGAVMMKKYHYFLNFLANPFIFIALIIGVLLALFGIYKGAFSKSTHGIWFWGFGVVIAVTALFFSLGMSGNVFYPSSVDLNSSLGIHNASSSLYTLKTMAYISVFIPFVLAYISYVWKSMDRVKMTRDEIEKSEHIY
ncbi:MAG: cytochrome d ubiquinol oxidase subunit II [Campylobacter sp.]|nr:cytochrome d ubiquinol oxidase subunit II [Campylobacter sp.]